jgi:FkbM family methyltransferase
VLLDRTSVAPEHIRHWAQQLDRNELSPAALFKLFLCTPEGRSRFRSNPNFAPLLDGWRAPSSFGEFTELVETMTSAQIVDVGAMALDFEDDVYAPLLDSGRWQVVGFEPNEDECRARQERNPDFQMLPIALGSGSPAELRINTGVATSSTLASNSERLTDFVGLDEWMTTVETRSIATRRLDDVEVVRDPALLKLDVQGGELAVLAGATRTLETTLVIHTETELFPLYRDNPLFGEIDRFLGARGFEFFTFHHEERYYHDDDRADRLWGPTRLLWADAVFVPDRDRLDRLDEASSAALCWVMHDLYCAYDYCAWVLGRLDQRRGTEFAKHYASFLDGPA